MSARELGLGPDPEHDPARVNVPVDFNDRPLVPALDREQVRGPGPDPVRGHDRARDPEQEPVPATGDSRASATGVRYSYPDWEAETGVPMRETASDSGIIPDRGAWKTAASIGSSVPAISDKEARSPK